MHFRKRSVQAAIFGLVTLFGLNTLPESARATAATAEAADTPPALGDAALERAVERIAGYVYGDTDPVDTELRRLGFPPDQLDGADWPAFSTREKLRHAVLMAENAEKGSGQRFLALLSASLAREFSPISEGTEPALNELLELTKKDRKVAAWVNRPPDDLAPPPVAFRPFDPKTPPPFPAHLEPALGSIATIVERAAPLGLPVEFLQVYCGVPSAKAAADIMRKHPTMVGRIKFALAGPPPRDAHEFARKVTRALHGIYGDLIATDPVLSPHLPAEVARTGRGITPPHPTPRPELPGRTSRSPLPLGGEESVDRFPNPSDREYERLLGLVVPFDGRPPTDSWPGPDPTPDHPSGGGGGGPGNDPRKPSPRSLGPVIERLHGSGDGRSLRSPDYAFGYDDLLPRRGEGRNPSLYDRVASEHLRVQPPEIRQRITVDRLKGVGTPKFAVRRGVSFSRLRGFHRVGGAGMDSGALVSELPPPPVAKLP